MTNKELLSSYPGGIDQLRKLAQISKELSDAYLDKATHTRHSVIQAHLREDAVEAPRAARWFTEMADQLEKEKA